MIAGVSLVVALLIEGGLGLLDVRSYQSAAVCSSEYSWMENAEKKSPCLVAAYMIGPCVGLDFTVTNISNPMLGYTAPGDPAAASPPNPNACYCSWAVYNLLSACTRCQDVQNGIHSYPQWIAQCGDLASADRPYPPTMIPSDNTTIPAWASVNPSNWTDSRWNVIQVKAVADQGDPDVSFSRPAPVTAPKPKNNIGAIAGGVVGGVVAVAIGVGIALFLLCRNKRRSHVHEKGHANLESGDPIAKNYHALQHGRSPSDMSAKSFGITYFSQVPPTPSPPTDSATQLAYSPTTFRTQANSIRSGGYESIPGSLSYAGTPPPGNRQGITPFTLHTPSTSQDSSAADRERKRVDSPTAHLGAAELANTIASRPRINPPAYSESPRDRGDFSSQAPDQASTYGASTSIMTTPPGATRHEKTPSATSQQSFGSSTSGGFWTHGNSTSFSGAADAISQMDSASLPGPPPANPPYPGPGPSTVLPSDEKRRPTIMNATSIDGDSSDHQPS